MPNKLPHISVIICTYNREDIILETLPAIAEQTVDPSTYEILIINNNSTDNTETVIKNFQSIYSNIRIHNENQLGLSHARNTGFKNAKYNWIVYIDDDAKANKNFIEQLGSTIQNYNFDCIGGLYLPWHKYPKPKWFLDRYGSNGLLRSDIGSVEDKYLSGGVLAINKPIIESLGGFSHSLGMSGAKIAYGEEIHLQNKLRSKGYKIGFDPDLIVYHLVAKYKLHPLWYLRRGYAEGRDYWKINSITPSFTVSVKVFIRIFIDLVYKLIQFSPKLFQKSYFIQNWVIDVFTQSFIRIGQLNYSLGTLFSSRRK
jgi:glycosyltransferase involved in cell wall biosynthesis